MVQTQFGEQNITTFPSQKQNLIIGITHGRAIPLYPNRFVLADDFNEVSRYDLPDQIIDFGFIHRLILSEV